MIYNVTKIKGSKEYGICYADDPKKIVINGLHGDKKKMIRKCAEMNGMSPKEFNKKRTE